MLIKYIRRMTETLESLGHDPGRLWSEEGWSDTRLSSMSGPALQREQYRMVRKALEVSGRPDLGVLVGASMSLMDFGPLGMLVASSSSGRVVFERVFQFLSIAEILWQAEYDLEGAHPYVAITYQESAPDDLHEYFLDEFAAAWNRFSQEVFGISRWANAFYVPLPETPDRLEKSALLGIPFVFDQPGYRFDFNSEMLTASPLNANPVVAAMLEQQCELIVRGLPNAQADVDHIRRVVSENLPDIPSVPEIAKTMNTSERSLRRICAKNGTTVRDIVLDVRLATACNHLRNSRMTVDEISYLVGYGSPPSFFHAFRNWAGVTPTEFRAKEAEFAASS